MGTGLEVEAVAAAGPVAEPLGVVVGAVLILLRSVGGTRRSALLPVETALLAAASLIVVPGAVAAATVGPGDGLLVLGAAATSAFTLVDALLGAVAGLSVLLVVRARAAGAGRPRWPWEGDDEP